MLCVRLLGVLALATTCAVARVHFAALDGERAQLRETSSSPFVGAFASWGGFEFDEKTAFDAVAGTSSSSSKTAAKTRVASSDRAALKANYDANRALRKKMSWPFTDACFRKGGAGNCYDPSVATCGEPDDDGRGKLCGAARYKCCSAKHELVVKTSAAKRSKKAAKALAASETKFSAARRRQAKHDAYRLCNAMYGWGTKETVLESIILRDSNTQEYLMGPVRVSFENESKCGRKSPRTLVKWIHSDTSCFLREKLLSKLTDKRFSARHAAQERLEFSKAAKQKGNAELKRIMKNNKPPKALWPAIKRCTAKMFKGAVGALKGWGQLFKGAWKAITTPIETASSVACAVRKATRWVGKKLGAVLSKARKGVHAYWKNTKTACGANIVGGACVKLLLKGVAAGAGTALAAAMWPVTLGVAVGYTIGAAFTAAFTALYRVFRDLVRKRGKYVLVDIVCEILGVIGLEFVILPFAIKAVAGLVMRVTQLVAKLATSLKISERTARAALAAGKLAESTKLMKATTMVKAQEKLAKTAAHVNIGVRGAAGALRHAKNTEKLTGAAAKAYHKGHHIGHKIHAIEAKLLTPAMTAKGVVKAVKNADKDKKSKEKKTKTAKQFYYYEQQQQQQQQQQQLDVDAQQFDQLSEEPLSSAVDNSADEFVHDEM